MKVAWMLLSQDPIQERMEGLRQGFNSQQGFTADFRGFIWFVVGMASVFLVLLLLSRRRQRVASTPHKAHTLRLFNSALRNLGVRLEDRWLLLWVAWRMKIPHPTSMLLSPDLLTTQLEASADRLKPGAFARYVRRRVAELGDAAFESD